MEWITRRNGVFLQAFSGFKGAILDCPSRSIVSVISSPSLTPETEYGYPFGSSISPLVISPTLEMSCSYTLALAHAVWHHSSIGQLSHSQVGIMDCLKHLTYFVFAFNLLYTWGIYLIQWNSLHGKVLSSFWVSKASFMSELIEAN